MPSTIKIINARCEDALKEYPDNHFDSVVADPPYGLGKVPDIVKVLQDWIDHGYHEIESKAGGFMGKEWDTFVPQPKTWKEIYRVLKPGGFMLVACGTRTQDWMTMSLRFAGFEIRDVITWHYGSGFPKSKDVSKAIDEHFGAEREVVSEKETKSGGMARINKTNLEQGFRPNNYNEHGNIFQETAPATEEAKKYEGWGTALKPATEFWTLVRKPLTGTVAENVLQHGTGGLNIDGCRISLNGESPPIGSAKRVFAGNEYARGDAAKYGDNIATPDAGRFPANMVLSHHPDCVSLGLTKIKGNGTDTGERGTGGMFKPGNSIPCGPQYSDADGFEVIEQWQCVDGCPVKELDRQSGMLTSGQATLGTGSGQNNNGIFYPGKGGIITSCYADTGGASRFFYCAKASTWERNKGLEKLVKQKRDESREHGQAGTDNPFNRGATEVTNNHPTVKPVKLIRWLIKLITPPDGEVLDPFAGSGTTGIASKLEGFNATLIDSEPWYCEISQARVDAWKREDEQLELFDLK